MIRFFVYKGIDGPLFSPTMKEYHKKDNVRGRIMLFNLEKPADGVRELMIVGNQFSYEDFAPHGISVLEEKGMQKITGIHVVVFITLFIRFCYNFLNNFVDDVVWDS